MNFGKLLAVGKGFLGGRGVVAYRKDKRFYLPKFNSAKNPFVPKVAEKKSAAAPAPQKAAAPVVTPVAAKTPAKTQKIPVFTAQQPLRAASWTERLNPFRTPAPVAPPILNPVQTELSLDAVKVLHNDLSDVDVEVVPVKSRTMAPTESPRLLPAREPLEFFGERQLETA
jgi:hypothetical protein